jgi:hypothetical protein
MAEPTKLSLLRPVIVMLIVAAVGLGGFAVLKLGSLTNAPDSFQLNLNEQWKVAESLLRFRQSQQIPLQVEQAQALAVGPKDWLYVSGNQVVHVYQSDGRLVRQITTAGTPKCLAAGTRDHVVPGQLYVGTKDSVQVFDEDGQPIATWKDLGDDVLITSIALTYDNVFVADAGNRVIVRLTTDGNVVDRIGEEADATGAAAGFVIPSPYFDVVADPNDLLYVVNPGVRQIETYSLNGVLEAVWGAAGSDIAAFFGCCNPSHLALLPDGRFVTSEKGIPRIKVYRANGEFDCVVAGPEQLEVPATSLGDPRDTDAELVFDVAVDGRGQVLVLDRRSNSIRVFVEELTLRDRKT